MLTYVFGIPYVLTCVLGVLYVLTYVLGAKGQIMGCYSYIGMQPTVGTSL